MADYPYVLIVARDASEAPISVRMQASSDSATTTETALIEAMTDFITSLPGVTLAGVTRYQVTETPL